MNLRIAGARVVRREARVPNAVVTSFGAMASRHLVLLVLRDADGREGVGESWINFPAWAPAERAAAFERTFIPYLRGKEVAEIGAFMAELEGALRGPSLQAGAYGPLLSALCAVELALWDLAAQAAGKPLYRLFFPNAPASASVEVYGSGLNHPLPWREIDELLHRGVRLFKLKLGFGDVRDRENLQALREHLGSCARIAVDCNRGWTLAEAQGWLPVLKDAGVVWLEEPLRMEEEEWLGDLRGQGVLIAAGENVCLGPRTEPETLAGLPLDILQPDITKFASLGATLKVVAAAGELGKRVVPHFLGSAPGQAASLHLAAGGPEALVEWDANPNPLRTEFFREPFEIQGGRIALPDRPGLGFGFD